MSRELWKIEQFSWNGGPRGIYRSWSALLLYGERGKNRIINTHFSKSFETFEESKSYVWKQLRVGRKKTLDAHTQSTL